MVYTTLKTSYCSCMNPTLGPQDSTLEFIKQWQTVLPLWSVEEQEQVDWHMKYISPENSSFRSVFQLIVMFSWSSSFSKKRFTTLAGQSLKPIWKVFVITIFQNRDSACYFPTQWLGQVEVFGSPGDSDGLWNFAEPNSGLTCAMLYCFALLSPPTWKDLHWHVQKMAYFLI